MTQAQSVDTLISNAFSDPANKPTLAKALMAGHIFIIATWSDPKSKVISVQDFIKNGKSYIPIFSDEAHFETETKGSGYETKGVSIDAHLMGSLLRGDETLILNPTSKQPIEFTASQFKSLVDPARLPKP